MNQLCCMLIMLFANTLNIRNLGLPVFVGLLQVVEDEGKKLVLICDPSSEEEKALDGKISFAINAHK